MTSKTHTDSDPYAAEGTLDVVLIGGGIMSATLGALLSTLQPDWSIVMLERLGGPALESSNAWANAGTGHAGLCELNYMPDPSDPARAADIGRQYALSQQFWAALVDSGDIDDPRSVVNPTPHMDVVFGERDIAYLRERFATLRQLPGSRTWNTARIPRRSEPGLLCSRRAATPPSRWQRRATRPGPTSTSAR
ncbi:malate:quinone oxidoreductase [Prescottella defluvii]|nr:malate:quinone oxidoreductase [Prescottella defluvii]